MKRAAGILVLSLILFFQQKNTVAHLDPVFFLNTFQYQHLVSCNHLAVMFNPSQLKSNKKYNWIAAVTDNFRIKNYNTLILAGSYRIGRSTLAAGVKNSSLSQNSYYRNMGVVAASVKMNYFLNAGTSFRLITFKMPGNSEQVIWAGKVSGLNYRISRKLQCAAAIGFYRPVSYFIKPVHSYYTLLNADIKYNYTKDTRVRLSGEMILGNEPVFLLSIISEQVSGVLFTAGIGAGMNLFTAGLCFDISNIQAGAVTSFNPAIGSTTSLIVSGQHKKP